MKEMEKLDLIQLSTFNRAYFIGIGGIDKVSHNQEITGKPHLHDNADFKSQPIFVASPLLLTDC